MCKENLISKPRKLLSITAEKHWSWNDNPHNTKNIYASIILETDKGTYTIKGCDNCSGLFWKLVKK